ncbi:hypothetical protein [Roseomonas sp. 18066]|uniref:hypothetical protein n=1 Tax=Roseomonas sp. 18066 TaxID=2681412 RepID=UPI00135B2BC1|nr:hypothetical protein [Roseomonas sp. 18066]
MNPTDFRPTDTTPQAIEIALNKARGVLSGMGSDLEAAKQRRDDLLIDGTANELGAAEADLAKLRGDAERLEAITTNLTTRLCTAKRVTALGQAAEAAKALTDADAELAAWWRRDGIKIKRLVADGVKLKKTVENAAMDYQFISQQAGNRYPDAELAAPKFDQQSNASDFASTLAVWADGDNLEGKEGIQ